MLKYIIKKTSHKRTLYIREIVEAHRLSQLDSQSLPSLLIARVIKVKRSEYMLQYQVISTQLEHSSALRECKSRIFRSKSQLSSALRSVIKFVN